MKTKTLALSVAAVLWAGAVLYPFLGIAASEPSKYPNPIGASTIVDILLLVIRLVQQVAVPLVVLAIMYGAFLYLTSGGDPKKISTAHKAITYSILGIIIIISARYLVEFVQGIGAGAAASSTLKSFAENLANSFGAILLGGSVLAVMYAAFLYTTGGEDPEKIKTANRVILFAVVAAALALLAFAIVNIVRKAVGL